MSEDLKRGNITKEQKKKIEKLKRKIKKAEKKRMKQQLKIKKKEERKELNQTIVKVIMQFIFSFVVLIVLLADAIKAFSNEIPWLRFFTELFLAIASNCCSISCTMMFVDETKNDEHYTNRRILYIVFSLAIYLILYYMTSRGYESMGSKEEITLLILLILSLILLIVIIHHIIKDFVTIQADNKKILDELSLSLQDKELVKQAHDLKDAVIGNETFNLGGDNDEN